MRYNPLFIKYSAGVFLTLRTLFFLLVSFVSLQACHPNQDEMDDGSSIKSKRNQAAGYNVQLGLEYLKQGNISRSKRKLLLAMKQNPNSPDVNAAMGYFMEKTGEIANAKRYYQKAMVMAPGRGTQLNNYGTFLCRQGQYTEAEAYFLKAVNDVQYEHTAGAFENAGLCVLAIPDDKKARGYFMKALQQDRSRKQSLYELLKIDMKLGHFDEAMILIQKYPDQVMHSRDLLALAAKVAHQVGKPELEEEYKRLEGRDI